MELTGDRSHKVTPRHLRRQAYLYIRQSTLRQVVENTESTERQYALRHRAVALGWAIEQVVVIDRDLGQSGASAADREGFQQLVRDVGLGRAGLVMGLEVSRLARNSTDWHRLLEICALTETLILDEDGLYDPAHFNDRLLLGLKGTMSEAELHVLRARLRGGIVNKARRGELEMPVPVGFVYDAAGRVVLDPDQRVQDTIRAFFDLFRRTGSATAVVKTFREQQLLFPRHARHGIHDTGTRWVPLQHSRALWVLHNPRFAGVFFFGRSRQRRSEARTVVERLPRDEWTALIPNAHPGYISWDEFEENQRRLRENAQAIGGDRRRSPPREGPALLQGIVVCGQCGDRMTVRYHQRHGARWPTYVCQRRGIARAEPICQSIPGRGLDEAIGRVLIETVTPLTLEMALTVRQELQSQLEETDRLHRRAVECARYEADLARRRYLQVDPANRLVADELEAHWNRALQQVVEAQDTYDRQRDADRLTVDAEARERILALATDFPRLWHDPMTPDRERKRMVRLLLEDVTLIKTAEGLTAHLRFRGGATTTLAPLARSLNAWQLRETSTEIVTLIDQLLDTHTDVDIATMLNARGYLSGSRQPFRPRIVHNIRRCYRLRSRYDRLRSRGMLTQAEIARRLNISVATVKVWGHHGLLTRHMYNDKHECLYEPPGENPPATMQGRPLIDRRSRALVSDQTNAVQYEA